MNRNLCTILACTLAAFGLTRTVPAADINVLLSTNGGVADINGLLGAAGALGPAYSANNLNDGILAGLNGGSLAHSAANQAGNYMEVTTPTLNLFSSVDVFNRTDCCDSRIDGAGTVPYTLTIYKGASVAFTQNYLYSQDITGPGISGQTITLPVGGIVGNIVRITQNNNDVMNLGELQGFGQNVPEPSSMILCGLGAVGLVLAARRRRKT